MSAAKVLLVDANEKSRGALSKALMDAGYEVAVAPSGSAAVSALEWERPDLVVSHAQVQDMDGYELLVKVRRDPTTMDTPFLLLAGRDRPVALAAREAGADMTVGGEVTDETVTGLVRELLGREGADERPGISMDAPALDEPATPLWAAVDSLTPPAMPSRPAFQGSLDIMDLAEVTQAIALSRKTGYLLITLSMGNGTIVFENGRVVHADFSGHAGEPAVAAILSCSQRETGATFRFDRADRAQVADGPKTISLGVEQLLLNIAVGLDEAGTRSASPEDAPRASRPGLR